MAFAAGEKREWLRAMGHRIFPVVGWAERGGYDAMSHGNSVPRFHVTWGTGPGIVEPFARRAREAEASGRLTFKFRHRVDALTITNGTVDGISGSILEPDTVARGVSSSRHVIGDFTLHGVTKPITLKAHLVGSGVDPLDKVFTVGFEATGTIKRSDFGVKQYLPLLGDEVHLIIAGNFKLQQ